MSRCDDVCNLHAVCFCWISVTNPESEAEADLGLGSAAHCVTLALNTGRRKIHRMVSDKEKRQKILKVFH